MSDEREIEELLFELQDALEEQEDENLYDIVDMIDDEPITTE